VYLLLNCNHIINMTWAVLFIKQPKRIPLLIIRLKIFKLQKYLIIFCSLFIVIELMNEVF